MEFDLPVTLGSFAVLVAIGTGALIGMETMPTDTILMMVLPSMVVFGAICLFLGVRYGEYRAAAQ